MRRSTDAALLARLSGLPERAVFSPGGSADTVVVQYPDRQGEVRRASDGAYLAALSGVVDTVVFPAYTTPSFAVIYRLAPEIPTGEAPGGSGEIDVPGRPW
jgi:hypothetical protein